MSEDGLDCSVAIHDILALTITFQEIDSMRRIVNGENRRISEPVIVVKIMPHALFLRCVSSLPI